MISVPMRAEEIQIGSGSQTDANLPTHSYYKYSLTQQIYTAAEIEDAGGGAGTINSIAFYNGGSTKTRNFSIYMVNTDKESFSGASDWITVSASDLVFTGNVEVTASAWTTITLDNPFSYDGGNLAVIVDDNTGSDVSGMACRIFTASATQSIYYRYDYTNPDPTNPTISGTITTNKNQIILDIETVGVTCAKPKNFNADGITAHTATLTWTAGGEGQTDWDVYLTTSATEPDDATEPTYQVTACSKALSGLTAQTTYYAYVRANCGDGDMSKWTKKVFTTTREALEVDATHPYSQNFETSNDWGFTNGNLTNQWCWGSATNNGGEKAIYVSNDNGTSNAYTINSTTVVYASKLFAFAQGTYTFVYDWKADGESNSAGTSHYDYLRVALVPGDIDFTAGTSLPSGLNASSLPSSWIALDGGHQLNKSADWQSQTAEAAVSGTYTMVFVWRNDSGTGDQPPAAIDNISISLMNCPRPTNLAASNVTGRTATLTWTENGTATTWVLQYATDSSFTENLAEANVSGTASKDLTGLTPETKYYARVKSINGSDESSWSDVKDFTTTATCEKPQLSYVTNSNTAFTGSVSWTGDADNYELIYSTKTSFEPGDEGVIQVNLGDVNTYTLQDLTPETTYRVKVRANCGADDGYSQWSNQISFSTTATCVAPSGLSATKTSVTITLSWTEGEAGQDAWDIRYKTGSNDYTYIHLDNHASTSYTITGLSPVTTYSVNVRAYCSEEDQSKWGYSSYNQNSDLSVTTECGALTMPYTCDFEGALETSQSSSYPMPKCWERKEYRGGYSGSYTYYPSVREASYSYPYAHGGNGESVTSGKSMHFYKPYASTDEAAILPEIDEQYAISDLQISFWARLESSQTNKVLSVGVMTDNTDITTFTEVGTVTVEDGTFREYTVFFDRYDGDGRYIAIRYNSSSTGYIFVDDVTVDEAPGCRIPTGFEATVESESEALLTWTEGTQRVTWNVQYKRASDSEWSELIPVNEASCTLTGLQRATVYEARVQTVCSVDDQSDWAETSFTTDCGIWPIDAQNSFFEDFENVDDFPPICWDKFSHEMSGYTYWYLNSNNGLGSSAAYSYWSEGDAFLVMPQMHIDGEASLSFDYLIGSGTYNESCSVVVSTGTMTYADFTNTIWEAAGSNSGVANAIVSLSDFDGEDIYIAFKFTGLGTSGCTWYIDNVGVSLNTCNLTIGAYTATGGWYLIASPLAEPTNPENVTNMIRADGDYDLYRFNQAADLEWENWKQAGEHYHFNLEPCRGYLYANVEQVDLIFKGAKYDGNGEVTVTNAGGSWPSRGWNLIGNPFTSTARIGRAFYRMNENREDLIAASGDIAGMEGVFVYTENAEETVTFSQNTKSGDTESIIALDLSRGVGGTIDRVMIDLNDVGMLPKYMFDESHANVSIPQDGEEYSVVNGGDTEVVPVNFRADRMGEYMLSARLENADVDYLHLIDRMTGEDVDLLLEGNYKFIGLSSDMADRFLLRFKQSGYNSCEEVFAYQYDGDIVLSGEGTLQVYDVMGRFVNEYEINGVETLRNIPAGIYILRLLGDHPKTQKIVVR